MSDKDLAMPVPGPGSRPDGSSQQAVSPLRASIPIAVIFLDFDGVICSPRAYTAQEGRWWGEQRSLRWADPVACDFVCQLLRKFSAKLVISSTWRFMEARCYQVLDRYDLSSFLHDDWRTGEDDQRHRGTEIATWLTNNGEPPFIILDDDSDFTAEQLPWHVKTDSVNGIMLADFDKAEKLLASAMSARSAETVPGSVRQDASAVGASRDAQTSPAQTPSGQS